MFDLLLALPLGVFAGFLTTLAGLGGGLVLVSLLSYLWSPHEALAVTSPALAIGNGHRAWFYRRDIDWKRGRPVAVGAAIGSLAGGLLAVQVPSVVVTSLIIVATILALFRSAGVFGFSTVGSPRFLFPASAALGAVSATSGGLRFLLAPLLHTSGLTGNAYLGTLAFTAVIMHVTQSFAYGATRMLDQRLFLIAMCMAAGILLGNVIGIHARKKLSSLAIGRIELGAIAGAAIISVAELVSSVAG